MYPTRINGGLQMIIDKIVQEVRNLREMDAKNHHYNLMEIASNIKINEQELVKHGWKIQEKTLNQSLHVTAKPSRDL